MKREFVVNSANKKREAILIATEVLSILERSNSAELLMPIIERVRASLRNMLPKQTRSNAERLMERKKMINEKTIATAANSRQRWTIHNDSEIMRSNLTDEKLAQVIGRSMLAIQVRRTKLRKTNTPNVELRGCALLRSPARM